MEIQQILIDQNRNDQTLYTTKGFDCERVSLVFAFGERDLLEEVLPYEILKKRYPEAQIIIGSSAGQISNNSSLEVGIVATAIQFDKTEIKIVEVDILENPDINILGDIVEQELLQQGLKALFVLSEGTYVNGTELVNQLHEKTDLVVPVFGGLTGDGVKFQKTLVGFNSDAKEGKVVVVGFYGDTIDFGFGCQSGWSDFGPEREVTLSEKNVLYKIGDRFALDLYKEYLGKYAEELPSSSLYFPLSMKEKAGNQPVVRTILAINEENKSMTFAGNIPQGSLVRLMKGNVDKLIDASYGAALSSASGKNKDPQLAFLVSCVGRKVVLGNRIDEELEAAKEALGSKPIFCGFYSYGEISPTRSTFACELHNQTIAIVTISEN